MTAVVQAGPGPLNQSDRFSGQHIPWFRDYCGWGTNSESARQLRPDEQRDLLADRLGITNLVPRATARADELTADELRAGGRVLAGKLRRYRPGWLAVLGVGAYRTAFGRAGATVGPQPDRVAGVPVWVLPNPSGLNASWPIPRLAEAFRELHRAAVD